MSHERSMSYQLGNIGRDALERARAFQKIVDTRNGEIVGILRTFPFQEFFFVDPYQETEVDVGDLSQTRPVAEKPIDFLQLEYVNISPGEYDMLIALHQETGDLFIR